MGGMKLLKLVNKIINYSTEDFLKKTNLSLSNYGLPKKKSTKQQNKNKVPYCDFFKILILPTKIPTSVGKCVLPT